MRCARIRLTPMNMSPNADPWVVHVTLHRLIRRFGLRKVVVTLLVLILRQSQRRSRATREVESLSNHLRRDIGLPEQAPQPPYWSRFP